MSLCGEVIGSGLSTLSPPAGGIQKLRDTDAGLENGLRMSLELFVVTFDVVWFEVDHFAPITCFRATRALCALAAKRLHRVLVPTAI